MKLVVLTLLTVLAACGGNRPTPQPGPKVPPGPAQLPDYELTINVVDAQGNTVQGVEIEIVPITLGQQTSFEPTSPDGPATRKIRQRTYHVKARGEEREVRLTKSELLTIQLAPEQPRQMRGRLQAQGRALTYPDGQRFRWAFATGFQLVHYVATGSTQTATDFLKWARNTGFNGVRV